MSKVTIDNLEIEKIVIESVRLQVAEKMNYNRVLLQMVEDAMESQSEEIRTILEDTIKGVVGNPNFKKTIKEEFERKVAKTLVGSLEGAVAKAASAYRSNPTLKSKMILAIEELISNSNGDDL